MHKGLHAGQRKGLSHGTYRGNVSGLVKGLYINDKKGRNGKCAILYSGGQSNDEYGVLTVSADLPIAYKGSFPKVQYYGADGVFRDLSSSSQISYQAPIGAADQFAHQFSLYNRLQQALLPLGIKKLYVISYCVGDTGLAVEWHPVPTVGANYTAFVNRMIAGRAAVVALNGEPAWELCLFDLGEKDSRNGTNASNFETNGTSLMGNIRIATRLPNLRFMWPCINLGAINAAVNPCTFGEITNSDKRDTFTTDNAIFVDTNDCQPDSGEIHYTWQGQYDKSTREIQALIDAGWIPGTATRVPAGQTYFNGDSSFLRFGDILDTLFAAAVAWRIGLTIWKPARYGTRTLFSKFAASGNQRSFHCYHLGDNLVFNYYMTTGTGANVRGVTWTGMSSILYDGNEHSIEIRYDGTLTGAPAGNGLNRPDLYIDGVLYTTGKNLSTNAGTLGTIFNSSARLAVGALVETGGTAASSNFFYDSYAREFFVQDGSAVDQVRVSLLSGGVDTSGNGNNGVWHFS